MHIPVQGNTDRWSRVICNINQIRQRKRNFATTPVVSIEKVFVTNHAIVVDTIVDEIIFYDGVVSSTIDTTLLIFCDGASLNPIVLRIKEIDTPPVMYQGAFYDLYIR